jgi:hypothetical protein
MPSASVLTDKSCTVLYACARHALTSASTTRLRFVLSCSGDTALHWACRSKAEDCISHLQAAGANQSARNAGGKTPAEVLGTGVEGGGEESCGDDGMFAYTKTLAYSMCTSNCMLDMCM